MSEVAVYRLVLESETPPREFPLTQEYVYIGRSPQNDIVINNPHLSRQHARLIRQKDVYLLEDLDSTNGTFVNDRRITHAVLLQPGDRIRLGPEVVLRFLGPEVELDPTVVAPVVEAPEPPTRILSLEHVHPPRPSPAPAPGHGSPSPSSPAPPPPASAPTVPPQPSPEPASGPDQPVLVTPAPPGSAPPAAEIVYTPRTPARTTWILLGCGGVVALVALACIAWLWWVDVNNLWCTYAFFRGLLPGCP